MRNRRDRTRKKVLRTFINVTEKMYNFIFVEA